MFIRLAFIWCWGRGRGCCLLPSTNVCLCLSLFHCHQGGIPFENILENQYLFRCKLNISCFYSQEGCVLTSYNYLNNGAQDTLSAPHYSSVQSHTVEHQMYSYTRKTDVNWIPKYSFINNLSKENAPKNKSASYWWHDVWKLMEWFSAEQQGRGWSRHQ